ncbi:hypothetical protein [Gimesia fumaroli]|nr:hypothetical protein [Gimesia fumaroli]
MASFQLSRYSEAALFCHPVSTMSVSPTAGYLTKKEIEEAFQRSHRSLTRDFSQAVRVGDSDILRNLKLRTEDGKEFEGTTVTLEQIQQLSNQGLSPTWYARREWVQKHYGTESAKKQKKQTEQEEKSTREEGPSSTATDNELVSTLKAQISRLEQENDRRSQEHQQDKESFMEQIKMFKDMFDTLKEDHTDTKELLKEVHQVMGKLADVNRLSSQKGPSDDEPPKGETDSDSDKVVDLGNGSTMEAVIVEEPKKAEKTSAKQGTKKGTPKKSTTATRSKRSVTPKSKPSTKTQASKPKWYETPTLNRFLSRK